MVITNFIYKKLGYKKLGNKKLGYKKLGYDKLSYIKLGCNKQNVSFEITNFLTLPDKTWVGWKDLILRLKKKQNKLVDVKNKFEDF